MGWEFDTIAVESCPEWLLQSLAMESEDKLIQIATVLWGVWLVRNKKVWDQKVLTPELAMQWSSTSILQWREAQMLKRGRATTGNRGNQHGVQRWKALDTG